MRVLTVTIALAVAPLAAAQSLEVSGSCPGEVTFDAAGLSPGATVAWLYGLEKGDDLISRGSCAGAASGLGGIRLGRMAEATFGGNSSVTLSLPDYACDTPVQVLDTATCAFTNVGFGTPPPAPIFAGQARGYGSAVYKVDVEAGTYEYAWDNFTPYTAMAGFDGRLFAIPTSFDGNIYELDPENGAVITSTYTGNFQPSMGAGPDGTLYTNWGGSMFTYDGNNLAAGGSYVGSMMSNNNDIAVDDEGNAYYIDDGNWGTVDFATGTYTDLGSTYGWESGGGCAYRDRVSAFTFHNGRFYAINTGWDCPVSELHEFNVVTGEATFVMELPDAIDSLGSIQ